jgi:D-glycero-alpha-D-manno-heptose 1-phosphate guanylyltransferase
MRLPWRPPVGPTGSLSGRDGSCDNRGVKAVILAGGLGTRLRAVVSDRPKPMAEAAGKPFLEYHVERLRDQGYDRLVFCVGYLAGHIRDHFGDGRRWGVGIEYAVETEPLGTAGALAHAAGLLEGGGPFFLLNGDSWVDLDFADLARRHREHRERDPKTAGSIVAVPVEDAAAYGTLELAPDGRVLAFREKGLDGPGRVNGGVYLLEPGILPLIPRGRAVSIEKETFPLLLDRQQRLYGYPAAGFFVDIGTPQGYRLFQRRLRGDNDTGRHAPGG